MRNICVVITARPSYSRIKTALAAIQAHPNARLQLVVAASALLDKFGTCVNYIEEDGFEVAARVFDNLDRLRDEFDAGEFVKIQGRTNQFNGRLQLVVENIRRVMTGPDSQDRRDGFREEAILPSAPRPIDEMWDELQQVVAAVGNPHLKALLAAVVSAHEPRLRLWPAASLASTAALNALGRGLPFHTL